MAGKAAASLPHSKAGFAGKYAATSDRRHRGKYMNFTQRISRLLLVLFTLVAAARGQTMTLVKPVSPREFVIMACGSSPTDPVQPQIHMKRISPYTSQEEDFGGEMDFLAPGAGILLKLM